MQISQKKCGDVLTLLVESERIDATSAVAFKDLIRSAAQTAPPSVILDLSKVIYVDPSGLGAIVNAKKVLAPATRLDLCTLSGAVDKVFKVTRMDSVFDIYPGLDQALSGPSVG